MAIGKKTGGGSRRGIPNKQTQARKAAIAASGLSPLDYMLSVMRNKDAAEAVRLDAAKGAAPYCHPKLAITTLKGDPDEPLHHRIDAPMKETREEWLARTMGAAAGAATGRNPGDVV